MPHFGSHWYFMARWKPGESSGCLVSEKHVSKDLEKFPGVRNMVRFTSVHIWHCFLNWIPDKPRTSPEHITHSYRREWITADKPTYSLMVSCSMQTCGDVAHFNLPTLLTYCIHLFWKYLWTTFQCCCVSRTVQNSNTQVFIKFCQAGNYRCRRENSLASPSHGPNMC